MINLLSMDDVDIVALTIWGEARGEPIEGQIAVAFVIHNRVLNQGIKEFDYNTICLTPKQFSCWNENDPNRSKLESLADELDRGIIRDRMLKQCLWISKGVLFGELLDNTRGSLNYMTTALFHSNHRPDWAESPKTKPFEIGAHTFFTA